jgi:hypothetical protein
MRYSAKLKYKKRKILHPYSPVYPYMSKLQIRINIKLYSSNRPSEIMDLNNLPSFSKNYSKRN